MEIFILINSILHLIVIYFLVKVYRRLKKIAQNTNFERLSKLTDQLDSSNKKLKEAMDKVSK